MIYIYEEPNNNKPIYLLLHGTGGDEHDLVPLVKAMHPGAGVISLRGEVNEHGMNRFFRRIRPGVFDLEDLEKRTNDIYHFLDEVEKKYSFKKTDLIAIGYSNGANMIANLLMQCGPIFKGAVLMHPMVPRRDLKKQNLSNVSVLVTAGKHDAICPVSETNDLVTLLTEMNASVSTKWFSGGHEITQYEVETIKEWINAF